MPPSLFQAQTKPRTEPRENLVGDGAASASQFFRANLLCAVLSDQRHHIAGTHAGDSGHIHQHLIHAQASHHRRIFSPYQNTAAPLGQNAGDPVRVADGHCRQNRFPFCFKCKAVARHITWLQTANRRYAGAQC